MRNRTFRHTHLVEKILARLDPESDLGRLVAEGRRGVAAKTVAQVIEALVAEVAELPEGGKVALQGFGQFFWKQRKPHPHYNMATKSMEIIPAQTVMAFEPAKCLRRYDVAPDSAKDRGRQGRVASDSGVAPVDVRRADPDQEGSDD